jgi:CRISPR-associated protein Csy1
MSKAKGLRECIEHFLAERFEAKAGNLAPDDPKRASLAEQFQLDTWIRDAARRVSQLQVVTHSLKPIHPDAKGTNLYVPSYDSPPPEIVGSHVLEGELASDVVGNAAALDVFKFLKIEYEGRTLLERVLNNDAALADALSDNPEEGREHVQAFARIVEPRGTPASHARAKQLYWLLDRNADPADDGNYHLLAPLYATSLAHRIFETLSEHRFGEAAKAGRQARRDGHHSENGYCDYPNLAVQKMGGTKPQNISQLNSERGGNNYLLASLPPTWTSSDIRPPLYDISVFERFGRQRDVRRLIRGLRRLLLSDPAPNRDTRDRRDEFVDALCDELLQFAAAHGALEPGWSALPECCLEEAQALWLDAGRSDEAFVQRRQNDDWPQAVRESFAGWLNRQLEDALPVGDTEYRFWAAQTREKLDALQEALPYV